MSSKNAGPQRRIRPVVFGDADVVAAGDAGGRAARLVRILSMHTAEAATDEPTRQTRQLAHALDRPVLPADAVQHREHHVGSITSPDRVTSPPTVGSGASTTGSPTAGTSGTC